MSEDDSPGAPTDAEATDSRSALLVAAAIVALVVAAFVMPPSALGAVGPGDGGPSDFDFTPDTEPPATFEDVQMEPGDDPSKYPVLSDGSGTLHSDCLVVIWDRLVPGKEVTVLVWNEKEYKSDRQVWFDGQTLGHTDAAGRVDGRVPYVDELRVTAEEPTADTCSFVTLQQERSFDEWRTDLNRVPVGPTSSDEFVTVSQDDGIVSTTLPVFGEPSLDVIGEPYPGETVELNATVDGVPMRSATVLANGQAVGKTNDDGRYTLQIPDDRTESLTIQVTRGDFSAQETVTVLLLAVDVRPSTVLAIPGQEATIVTTLGDRDVSDVTVRLGDETLGTPGTEHRPVVDLPWDEKSVVTATGHGQTATAPLWPLYLQTALVGLAGLGVVAGLLVRTGRRSVTKTTRQVTEVFAGLAVLLVAWILGGWQGLILLLGIGGVIGLLLASAVSSVTVWATNAIQRVGRRVARIVETVARNSRRAVIHLADRLLAGSDWLAQRIRAGLAQLSSISWSPRGMVGLLRGWVRGVSALLVRVVRGGRTLAGAMLQARVLGTVAVVVGVIGIGYAVEAVGWALIALAALAVGLGYRRRRSAGSPEKTRPTDPVGSTARKPTAESNREASGRPSLRTLWRTFARWVVPGRWVSQTPGDVARQAVDQGFPRGPVERLTNVFREVEYGDRSLSEERYARAKAALRALRTTGTDEGEPET